MSTLILMDMVSAISIHKHIGIVHGPTRVRDGLLLLNSEQPKWEALPAASTLSTLVPTTEVLVSMDP